MTTTPVGYAPDTCSLLAVDKAVASEAEREQLWESLLGPFFLWRLSIVEAVLEELEEKPDQTEARIRPLRGLPAVISRQQQLGEHGVSSLNDVRLRYPRMSGATSWKGTRGRLDRGTRQRSRTDRRHRRDKRFEQDSDRLPALRRGMHQPRRVHPTRAFVLDESALSSTEIFDSRSPVARAR